VSVAALGSNPLSVIKATPEAKFAIACDAHQCLPLDSSQNRLPLDSSQNALRVVREATENK